MFLIFRVLIVVDPANFALFNRDFSLKVRSLFIADGSYFLWVFIFGQSFIPIKIIIDPSDFLSILIFFFMGTKFPVRHILFLSCRLLFEQYWYLAQIT